jgi:hypothetical protein
MLTIPCFAAVAAAKGEIGKGKFRWTLLFWVVVSMITSSIVYSFGTMFADGSAWSIFVCIGWIVAAVLVTVGIVLYNKCMNQKEETARKLARK